MKLSPETEIISHAKLIAVLTMIAQCDSRINSDEDAHACDLYTFCQKQKLRERINFRHAVLNRLQAYYAKLLFKMAGRTYNALTPPGCAGITA